MNIENLFLDSPVQKPSQLQDAEKINNAAEGRKEELAKKFESIFVNKLLDQMQESVDAFNEDKDAASKQVHGLFNMLMAKHVSKNGGMGLWEDIYEFVTSMDKEQINNSVDKSL